MLKQYKPVVLWIAAAFLFVSLACNLPGASQDLPVERIPVSTEAVGQLEQNVSQAMQDILNGQPATLVITESELTSLVALRLQGYTIGAITDSQVFLRNGDLQYRGSLEQGPISAPIQADLSLSAGPDGRLVYDIVSSSAGPFGSMDALMDQIKTQLDQALYSSNSQLKNIFIENVLIANGTLTISGRPR